MFLFTEEKITQFLTQLRDMFLHGEEIGQNYKLVKTIQFKDEQNTIVYIYKLETPLSKAQLKEQYEKFYQIHPEWKDEEKLKEFDL